MKISEIEYKRPNLEELKAKYAEYTKAFTKEGVTAEEQAEIYRKVNETDEEIGTMASLAYIRFTLDTTDEFYVKEMDFYNEAEPVMTGLKTVFAEAMLKSPHRKYLEKEFSPLIFTNYEILKKSYDPIIEEDCVEENKLQTEYKRLLSSAKIPFNGEILNISQLGKYKDSPDREIRRQAFNSHGEFMKENGDKFDDIYDKMVKVRTRMAQKMGYKNYVELGYYRMGRNCYSPEDIAKFREQLIKDWVPFVCKLKKQIADELGIDQIMLYDDNIYIKEGNPQPIGSAEEMFANGKKMYEEMSAETGEFIRFMLDHDLFDVIAREGKSNGGYCTELPSYKMPFIFANFDGTSGDVDVLTHEAGHALASYKAMNSGILAELRQGGMETCEVHSMSMEFFAWKWMELFFGDRANDYRHMHLLNAITFLPYGTMVDYFQQKVYENPEMTPAERKQLWLELEEIFRPYLSNKGITYMEDGGRWQYQSHIYERPFYYIDYCLAQTIAFDFLIQSKENYGEAFANYDNFLKAGGSKTFVDLVKGAGFKLPFEDGKLAEMIKKLNAIV